jgi:hypothetical protein
MATSEHSFALLGAFDGIVSKGMALESAQMSTGKCGVAGLAASSKGILPLLGILNLLHSPVFVAYDRQAVAETAHCAHAVDDRGPERVLGQGHSASKDVETCSS